MARNYSPYHNQRDIAEAVAAGTHRELVGGRWDDIGLLQLETLKRLGLAPNQKFLDIGCGCLRGGVHLVRYLDPSNYWGTDLNESLLQAGYDRELKEAGLQHKLPRDHLLLDTEFAFDRLSGQTFDRALAFSVFTHLPLNSMRVCLERLWPLMKEGGVFYATYFELPQGEPSHIDVQHEPGGVVTHGDSDPYHYSIEDLKHIASGLPWRLEIIGDFGHPRAQRLAAFVRERDSSSSVHRRLSVAEAGNLEPGADHYRAFVGPPGRFDIMSASQFALLFQLGLRDHHKVLDFGCGSLRLGRLLIPYLQKGRYHGIDPNKWLIKEGVDRELGRDALRLKAPRFAYNDDFDCSVFAERFDFLIAQSIITHTGPDLLERMLSTVKPALAERGLFLFSYIQGDEGSHMPEPGWHYPGCVAYGVDYIDQRLRAAGLVGVSLPWFHPGARWYMAAQSKAALPSGPELASLNGSYIDHG